MYRRVATILVLTSFSPVFGANEDLKMAISRAKQKISSAQTYISTSQIELQSINREKERLESEKGQYERETKKFRELTVKAKQVNDAIVNEIKNDLSPKLRGIEQDIAEEEHNIESLGRSLTQLSELELKIQRNQKSFEQLLSDFQDMRSLYISWLSDFDIYLNSNKPDFDTISDRETFNAVMLEVSNFFASGPSTSNLLVQEGLLKQRIEDYTGNTDRLVQEFRNFSSDVKLATYRRLIQSDRVIDSLRVLDIRKSEAYKQATRLYETVEKGRWQRNLIQFEIVRIWTAYAIMKFHLVNIGEAVELIAEIDKILQSPNVLAEISSKADYYSNKMQELTGSLYPFSAQKMIQEASSFHDVLFERIDELGLSEEFEREASSILIDFRNRLSLYTSEINSILENSDEYLSEWKRYVSRRKDRLGSNISSECLSIADKIEAKSSADANGESLFIQFRTEC